jgi:glutamine---fructose-6-phosphate transaminase (isomerizing)
MCGIVGYIGPRDATPIILTGLKRLEYRGYDSAGVAVINNNQIDVRRDAGKLQQLVDLVAKQPLNGAPGIGHTRWATHGAPSARNAHPHVGNTGKMVVVHNGIVENFLELKDELGAEGVTFNSDTDTETIVHLAENHKAAGFHLKKRLGEHSSRSKARMWFCCFQPTSRIRSLRQESAMRAAWWWVWAMAKITSLLIFLPFLNIPEK